MSHPISLCIHVRWNEAKRLDLICVRVIKALLTIESYYQSFLTYAPIWVL